MLPFDLEFLMSNFEWVHKQFDVQNAYIDDNQLSQLKMFSMKITCSRFLSTLIGFMFQRSCTFIQNSGFCLVCLCFL